MSSENKPKVLVVGATGATGTSIVNGLLRSGNFHVIAVARSSTKPSAVDMQERGAEIRICPDIAKASHAELVALLKDTDIVVSAITAYLLDAQRPLFTAAKEAGVKRVVPCDFSSHAPQGAMLLQDLKNAVRDHIIELGLGYSFIEVGIWYQALLPYPAHFVKGGLDTFTRRFHAPGKVPTAGTDLNNIGNWVALILADARTLNKTVFVWEDHATQEQLFKIARAKCGDTDSLNKLVTETTEAELKAAIEKDIQAGPSAFASRAMSEYAYSMWYRGDNTVEKAVQDGALDARVLYPDQKAKGIVEFAEGWYPTLNVPFQ
ncbi:hypothetical protein HDZ31DRAFT_82922 [Schizophyllum fasciatum]